MPPIIPSNRPPPLHVLVMPVKDDDANRSGIAEFSASSIPLSASAWGSLNLRISGRLKRATGGALSKMGALPEIEEVIGSGQRVQASMPTSSVRQSARGFPCMPSAASSAGSLPHNLAKRTRPSLSRPRPSTATGGGSCQVRSDAERCPQLLHHARDFGGRKHAGEGAPQPFHPLLK